MVLVKIHFDRKCILDLRNVFRTYFIDILFCLLALRTLIGEDFLIFVTLEARNVNSLSAYKSRSKKKNLSSCRSLAKPLFVFRLEVKKWPFVPSSLSSYIKYQYLRSPFLSEVSDSEFVMEDICN